MYQDLSRGRASQRSSVTLAEFEEKKQGKLVWQKEWRKEWSWKGGGYVPMKDMESHHQHRITGFSLDFSRGT